MKIYGIEKSPDMIEAAKKSLSNNFYQCNVQIGDALRLPYDDNEFDLVVSVRFIPHILTFGQAIIALKEFQRVTNKYVIVQLREREERRYRRRLPKSNEKMDSWLYPIEIEKLLSDVGFQILEKSEVFSEKGSRAYLCKKTTMK